MDLSIVPPLFDVLGSDNFTVALAPVLPPLGVIVAIQSLVIAALVAWGAVYLVPYFYVRRASTGYIEGSESSHLLSGGANVPVIHALLLLKGKLTPEGLKAALVKAGIPHKRFQRLSQCVSSEPHVVRAFDPSQHWPPYFVTDPNLNLDHHVRWLPSSASISGDASGAGGGNNMDDRVVHNHATLSKHLSAIINTPPPLDRPPWEMLVVRHFDASADTSKHVADGTPSSRSHGRGKKHTSNEGLLAEGSALILRVHHVLSDGLALVAFMDAITEECGEGSVGSKEKKRSSLESAMRVGLKHGHTVRGTGGWVREAAAKLLHNVTLAARVMVELPVSMYKDYITAPDEDNALKLHSGLSGRKRVAWDGGSAISLQRIKHVKDKLGVKLNDVLLACATAALRQALIDAHHNTKATSHHQTNKDSGEGSVDGVVPCIRFFAPMSARATSSLSALPDLNNRLSVLSLPLPTGLTNPLARLYDIARLTESLKSSTVPFGLSLLWTPMGYMPKDFLQAQSDFLCHKCTGVLTNVPGPSHEVSLGGHKVTDLMFWVPAVGSIGMVLSIITYAHTLAVGLVVDETVPCDPDSFLRHFHTHFLHYERIAQANTDH